MDVPLRVLVVDDDPDFRILLRWQLGRTAGLEVVGDAADGFEALELVDELAPDAVVIDLMMPGMDGFELITQLLARDETPGMVAYSAMATDQARAQVAQLGVELMTKSGDHASIADALRRSVG